MLYGGNRDLAQTADAKICAAHRCELSIEEHALSDKYPNLCKKHARIAHMQEEDDIEVEEEPNIGLEDSPVQLQMKILVPCGVCGTLTEFEKGDYCPLCKPALLQKKMDYLQAVARYAIYRANLHEIATHDTPRYIAQVNAIGKARRQAIKLQLQYKLHIFIS